MYVFISFCQNEDLNKAIFESYQHLELWNDLFYVPRLSFILIYNSSCINVLCETLKRL